MFAESAYLFPVAALAVAASDIAEVEKFINDNIDKVERDKIIVYSDLDKKEFKEKNFEKGLFNSTNLSSSELENSI